MRDFHLPRNKHGSQERDDPDPTTYRRPALIWQMGSYGTLGKPRKSEECFMARTTTANSNWGKPGVICQAAPVPSFEQSANQFKLQPSEYRSSREPREWAAKSKNQKYAPEDPLEGHFGWHNHVN
jgi:hypothetical protein